jgi:Na+/phosphate symporter
LAITAHAVLDISLDFAAASDVGAHTVLDAVFAALEAACPVRGLIGSHFWSLVVGGLQVVEVVELVALFGLQQCERLLD